MKSLAFFALCLNPILWASFYVSAKPGIEGTSPLIFSTIELFATFPIAIALVVVRMRKLSKADALKGAIAGCSLYSVVWLSAMALSMTTATETAFFPALNGLFAALIAWVLARKSVSPMTWLGAIVASGGVLFVMWGVEGRIWGNMIALVSAVAYTVYIYVAAWATNDENSDLWLIFGIELLTMIALATMFSARDLAGLSGQSERIYWTALYVGTVTTVLPTAISIFFQRYISPVTTGFLYSLEPVWSAIFAGCWLGESLQINSYVGGACIIAGVGLYTIDQARKNTSVPSRDRLA